MFEPRLASALDSNRYAKGRRNYRRALGNCGIRVFGLLRQAGNAAIGGDGDTFGRHADQFFKGFARACAQCGDFIVAFGGGELLD